MFDTHVKFYSENGKRKILIAEDEFVNREILGNILRENFEILFAEDGAAALRLIEENAEILSLVLLDLNMPVLSGQEVLQRMKENPALKRIPVIVLTADQEAEVESLMLGAVDFIPKPYPQAGVILARMIRTIELFEDRQLIRSTERDSLTGLYTKEYFYQYAEQYDQHHRSTPMDAIVLDINRFHIINDRFGMAYGDEILRGISEKVLEVVRKGDGIVCRKEADTFLIYCPHGLDYKELLENASVGLKREEGTNNHVRLRLGVYVNADKGLDIERRFDRAKMAADIIRNNVAKNIEIYDDSLREKELYAERLVDDFHTAVEEEQFQVYFQPKMDIRGKEFKLTSAEALVRWKHPQFGMISPVTFISLFEENGLIQELDHFVWRATAKQIKEWKDRLGYCVPVSVNVSRIDLYNPNLKKELQELLDRNGLEARELHLEITESAYTEDMDQVISMLGELREMGFQIEMDDFGTGYSSLNMISALPIDALKLDMKFIRSAFTEQTDTRMLEVIIDMAGYLGVPVIAEGVETEEQVYALKAIGCDIVQGYYFSKPVDAEGFEPFLLKRIEQKKLNKKNWDQFEKKGEKQKSGITFSSIAQALSQDYFSIYYVDTESDWFVEYSSYKEYQNLGIEKSGENFFELSHQNILRVIHPEDQERFLMVFTKENVMKELEENRTFTLTYRLMFNGTPNYVHLKATKMDQNDSHIVIGVSNIDEQMRREEEHVNAIRIANQDPLTGVKSKHAYSEDEKKCNLEIGSGNALPFAVVVCDVNGLKQINDTLGHKAGDQYIMDAAQLICAIFQHSPVYRIGGDEFVVILRGEDYLRRQVLTDSLQKSSTENKSSGGVVVACGLSEYVRGEDPSYAAVFERADALMYQNKKLLKGML